MNSALAGIRSLLAAHLSSHRIEHVALLGEGLENAAYLVNSELVVRTSKEPDPVARSTAVRREGDLLALVAGFSPRLVPEPIVIAEDALVYRMLPGVPLIEIPVDRRGCAVAEPGACWAAFSPRSRPSRSTG